MPIRAEAIYCSVFTCSLSTRRVAVTLLLLPSQYSLFPTWEMFGAALSLVAGNFVGLAILIVPTGERFTMPTPVYDGARIIVWSAVGYLLGHLLGEMSVQKYVVLPLQFMVLTVAMLVPFYVYNLFGARN